jgi:hypothetical protein
MAFLIRLKTLKNGQTKQLDSFLIGGLLAWNQQKRKTHNETIWIFHFVCCHFDWQLEITGNEFASWIHAWGFWASWGCYLVRGLFSKKILMNEVEFVLRRILRVGLEYAREQNETRSESPALALHRMTAQLQLLNYLEKTFLERNTDDKQN